MKAISTKDTPDNIIPTKPGKYWARTSTEFKWWNLLVEIHGETPFLKVTILLCFNNPKFSGRIDQGSIYWGPEVVAPEPPAFRTY